MPASWTRWRRNCRQTYLKSGTLKRKDETREIRSPSELLDAIFEWGRKGLALQRYKGLGEMNPEQLWETTLDENARSLLVVKVQHADEAGELFAKLMGDVVEPRREFIQDNALVRRGGYLMGFRFQKRLSILPGVRINLSQERRLDQPGSARRRCEYRARMASPTNAGIPGTGLSYRPKLGGHGGKARHPGA